MPGAHDLELDNANFDSEPLDSSISSLFPNKFYRIEFDGGASSPEVWVT